MSGLMCYRIETQKRSFVGSLKWLSAAAGAPAVVRPLRQAVTPLRSADNGSTAPTKGIFSASSCLHTHGLSGSARGTETNVLLRMHINKGRCASAST